MTTLWRVTIRELLVARADLVKQIGFLQYDIGEFREPAQLGFEMLTQMRERLEALDEQLAVKVTLPDDPGVLKLVAQAERLLGALVAMTSSEELALAHTVS